MSTIGRVMMRGRSDVTLAVLAGGLVAVVSLGLGLTWLEAAGGALLAAPLVWRRRWPLAILGVVACAVPVYLALVEPSPVFLPPVLVALYTVGAHGSRRRTVGVSAGLPPYALMIVMLFSPEDGSDVGNVLQQITQFGFALAVGEAVRSQRAFIAALRERAERAEREQELEALRRVDEERMRIARDVHDVVSHSIATISTQASVGVHVGREEPARAVEVLESIKQVSAQALRDLRHALGVLRDDSGDGRTDGPADPTPSVHDVPGLVQQARDSGLSVVLRMEGSSSTLPTALQIAIYRIIQEGLTNVMRHAGGARATVRVAVGGHEVEVDVIDDGAGPPTASSEGSGTGLVGMRQRASAMGGELVAGQAPDGGFRVRAVLPLEREPA